MTHRLIWLTVFAMTAGGVTAAEKIPAGATPVAAAAKPAKPAEKPFAPGGIYRVHDMNRPRPKVIEPGVTGTPDKPGRPPSDAIVLFDGTDLSKWRRDIPKKDADPSSDLPKWKVENGYMEVLPKSGSLHTVDKFGSAQYHIEWATPSVVAGNSQGRGNSGIFIPGFGETQVLDSFENDTYPDGQAAAFYGKYPPLVNACRKPGEWQTYDIITEFAKVDDKGQIVKPARITVIHNGIVAHHAVEFPGRQAEGPLGIQDHNNPMRFRNIWVRPLKGYDEP